jgi:hypothetical protein
MAAGWVWAKRRGVLDDTAAFWLVMYGFIATSGIAPVFVGVYKSVWSLLVSLRV